MPASMPASMPGQLPALQNAGPALQNAAAYEEANRVLGPGGQRIESLGSALKSAYNNANRGDLIQLLHTHDFSEIP